MSFSVHILMNGRTLYLSAEIGDLKRLGMSVGMSGRIIESLDNIYEISITKDLVILTTEDPDFRGGALQAPFVKESRKVNNINAYDWEGNHLWNIADLVGDIRMAFWGGSVTTVESLKGISGFDAAKFAETDGHDLYACTAGGFMYVIDLDDRRIVQIFRNIK